MKFQWKTKGLPLGEHVKSYSISQFKPNKRVDYTYEVNCGVIYYEKCLFEEEERETICIVDNETTVLYSNDGKTVRRLLKQCALGQRDDWYINEIRVFNDKPIAVKMTCNGDKLSVRK